MALRAFVAIPTTLREWTAWMRQADKFVAPPVLPAYTVLDVPDASQFEGGLIYVTDEAGGKTIAFSSGDAWRRVQDRAVIS